MTRWEYRSETDEAKLGALGLAGWELVSVVAESQQGMNKTFYMKRALPSLKDEITLAQRGQAKQGLGQQTQVAAAGAREDKA